MVLCQQQSPMLCTVNSSLLIFFRLLAPLLNFLSQPGFSRTPFLSCLWPENSLKAVNWGNHRIYFVSRFSVISVLGHFLIPSILKSVVSIYFVHLFWLFRQEGKSSPCYPIFVINRSSQSWFLSWTWTYWNCVDHNMLFSLLLTYVYKRTR